MDINQQVHFDGEVELLVDDEVHVALVVVEVGLEGADVELVL